MEFQNDIPTAAANAAYYGTSWSPEKRGESSRREYAETLAEDYEELKKQAEKGGTLDIFEEEFSRYRAGYRKRTLAYLHSSARCVSWFIAGPSNFPAARMNKRAEISHQRLNDLIDFRARALAAIRRKLRPDLAPIYASDADALERLETKITQAEALQARMKQANATIRKHAKAGDDGRTYIAEWSQIWDMITIMRGDMKYHHETINADDPRFAALRALFD